MSYFKAKSTKFDLGRG